MARSLAVGLLASVLAVGLLLAPPLTRVSLACSCARSLPVAQALQQADAVFSGRVYLLERTLVEMQVRDVVTSQPVLFEGIHARFEVIESWKGIGGRDAEVWTGSGGGDCGYSFEFSQEYLVFATSGAGGRLFTDSCSNTMPLAASSSERAQLGAGVQVPFGPHPWEETRTTQPPVAPMLSETQPFQPWTAVAATVVLVPVSLGAFWLLRRQRRS